MVLMVRQVIRAPSVQRGCERDVGIECESWCLCVHKYACTLSCVCVRVYVMCVHA